MDKTKWYFENPETGEFTDDRLYAEWWTLGGTNVNCWTWSDFFQDWGILMIWESVVRT